jgi:hypothetical protein
VWSDERIWEYGKREGRAREELGPGKGLTIDDHKHAEESWRVSLEQMSEENVSERGGISEEQIQQSSSEWDQNWCKDIGISFANHWDEDTGEEGGTDHGGLGDEEGEDPIGGRDVRTAGWSEDTLDQCESEKRIEEKEAEDCEEERDGLSCGDGVRGIPTWTMGML